MSKLYVIFHGSWAFVDNTGQDCIHAYAADIPEHVFMGGSWLGETKILRGSTLELSVGEKQECAGSPGGDGLRHHGDTIIVFPARAASPVGAYAEVRLPRPENIRPQIPVHATVTGTSCESTVMGLVPVFQYQLSESRPEVHALPCGQKPPAAPFWTADPPVDGVTTLHFFAADDTAALTDTGKDFRVVASLLGFHAGMKKPHAEAPPVEERTIDIDEMDSRAYEITMFLNERVQWLHLCGKGGLRPGGAGRFPEIVVPLCTDLSSCGGGGGGS